MPKLPHERRAPPPLLDADAASWEAMVGEGREPVDWQRFARNGGLGDMLAGMDAQLDGECHETTRRIAAMNDLVRRLGKRATTEVDSTFLVKSTTYPLGVVLVNAAKRLAGDTDLVRDTDEAGAARAERLYPFSSLAGAWYFALEPRELGIGEQRLDIAEDRPEDLRARARAADVGRERPRDEKGVEAHGWLPPAFISASSSHTGTARARGADGLELGRDVVAAFAAARLSESDLELLRDATIGRRRSHMFVGQLPPAEERRAPERCWCGAERHRVPAGRDFSDMRPREAFGRWWSWDKPRLVDLARERGITVYALREQLGVIRFAVEMSLHRRGLLAEPVDPELRRARSEARRAARPRPERDPFIPQVEPLEVLHGMPDWRDG